LDSCPHHHCYHSEIMQLQLSNQTTRNRFPKIFNTIRQLQPNPERILSFGCSTGEECFTLADMFPRAEIIGVDVSTYVVSTARRNNKYDHVFFHDELGGLGKFDIVLSLMVLFSISEPIPFETWNKTIENIDKHIKYGGLWAIYTSQFPFSKSSVFPQYEKIRRWRRVHPTDKKKYYNGYYRKSPRLIEYFC